MHYSLRFYSQAIEDAILALSPDLAARFVRYGMLMEQAGPDLGMPHTRAMGDGLFELRMMGRETIARVFYCTLKGRRIVFLHHFIKKTQKTPANELAIAYARLKEVKNAEF